MRFFFFILVLLFCASLFAQNISKTQLEEEVLEIAHELRCPVCQGLSVKESMNATSTNMKKKIHTMLLEGKNRQQILGFFEERYGEWVLRNPKKTGLNISLWALPFAAIVFVSLYFFFFLKKKYTRDF